MRRKILEIPRRTQEINVPLAGLQPRAIVEQGDFDTRSVIRRFKKQAFRQIFTFLLIRSGNNPLFKKHPIVGEKLLVLFWITLVLVLEEPQNFSRQHSFQFAKKLSNTLNVVRRDKLEVSWSGYLNLLLGKQ